MAERDPGNHDDGRSCKLCGGNGWGGETCPHCGREPTAQQVMDARLRDDPHALLAAFRASEAENERLRREVEEVEEVAGAATPCFFPDDASEPSSECLYHEGLRERLREVEARNVLLVDALEDAQNTVGFMHGCLTDPVYQYAFPEQTMASMEEWAKLAPRDEPCGHSFTAEGCPGCEARNARFKRMAEARAALSGSRDALKEKSE